MATSATLKGTNYTKVAGVVAGTLSAGDFVNASKMLGTPLRVMYDEYSHATVAYDAGSIISMGLLPKGARVLGFAISAEATGANMTADVTIGGVAATTAECLTDTTSDVAVIVPALPDFQLTPLTEDSVVALVTAANPTGIGDKISLAVLYTLEM